MSKILVLKFRLNRKTGEYNHKWTPFEELPELKEGDVYQILIDEEKLVYEVHMIQNEVDVIIDTKHSLSEFIEHKADILKNQYKNKK